MVRLEFGRVRVEGAGTYAEQAVVVPRAGGFPDPSLIAVDLGAASVRYMPGEPHDLPELLLGVPSLPPGTPVVGSLWTARFMVDLGSAHPFTDVPFVTVRQGVPGPDCTENCNVPGVGALAAIVVVAAVAGLARRRASRKP